MVADNLLSSKPAIVAQAATNSPFAQRIFKDSNPYSGSTASWKTSKGKDGDSIFGSYNPLVLPEEMDDSKYGRSELMG